MITNERGIALVITLLVVALLTITVIEFTYSVQVDQHMARNALSGLQASLLARSGINLGEAFLLHDTPDTTNPNNDVDAFTEEWCPDPSPDGHACRIDETSGQVLLPPNMRLKVEIIDEGGKLNINAVALRNKGECDAWNSGDESKIAQLELRKSMLEAVLTDRGVPPEVADDIFTYWGSVFCQQSFGSAGPTPPPGAGPTAPPGSQGSRSGTLPPTTALPAPFASLDDAALIPPLTPSVIRKLRPVLTALPTSLPYAQIKVNINTAPIEVLNAILGSFGSDAVSGIVTQRSQAPMTNQDLEKILSAARNSGGQSGAVQNYAAIRQMLGVTSQYFQVRASGVVNPNPVTGRGGIGRSATMLVRRIRRPPSQVGGASAVPWTLTQLDWQKEGGGVLFQVQGDQEPGMADQAASGSGG